jgi:hypothetical protein
MMVTTPDDYSPRYVGDTADPLNFSFVYKNGNPYLLSNATNLTLILINQSDTSQVITGQGTWAISNPSNGTASYQFAPADVAQAGLFAIRVTMLINGQQKTFPSPGYNKIIEFVPVQSIQ